MNTILLVFAVLSIGAIAVATYVFTVAARNYVSNSAEDAVRPNKYRAANRAFVERSEQDRRRSDNVIQFPITLANGEVISCDRRTGDRRTAS